MPALLAVSEAKGLELETLAETFKALSDPTRLKILRFLSNNPGGKCCATEQGICACDLEDVTKLSQPTVSHHMKLLVTAGLVLAEKRGKWIYYTLNPTGFGLTKEFLQVAETPVAVPKEKP